MTIVTAADALSVRQPWAWLIVHGYKDVENRTWRTKYRGPVLVHASKKLDASAYEELVRLRSDLPLPAHTELERGGIVGRVRIVDCVDKSDSPWFTGPHGFVLADPEPLPFVPVRGRLGFFKPQFEGVA